MVQASVSVQKKISHHNRRHEAIIERRLNQLVGEVKKAMSPQ